MKPIMCGIPAEILEYLNSLILDEVDIEEEEIPFNEPCDSDKACENCLYEDKCESDQDDSWKIEFSVYDDDEVVPLYGIPDIDHVVFSEPATIVFWEDGTKTVVKCMKGERYERYAGFMAACMKKMFGSTSRAKSVMNYFTVEQAPKTEKKKKKKENEQLPGQMSIDDMINPLHEAAIKEAVDEALAK